MTLYVPEIGDNLLLTRNWQFKLHPERRNSSIYTTMGLTPFSWWKPIEGKFDRYNRQEQEHIEGWIDTNQFVQPDYKTYNGNWGTYHKDYDAWSEVAKKNMIINDIIVNFPAGTLLKVDRIYIRKGAKDYSSVTFHAKNIEIVNGEFVISKKKKPKSFRFWAKLHDCNNINFELQEETK